MAAVNLSFSFRTPSIVNHNSRSVEHKTSRIHFHGSTASYLAASLKMNRFLLGAIRLWQAVIPDNDISKYESREANGLTIRPWAPFLLSSCGLLLSIPVCKKINSHSLKEGKNIIWWIITFTISFFLCLISITGKWKERVVFCGFIITFQFGELKTFCWE